ncbi:MAG: CCA tRNA nucleotidyltransferase [Acidobacteria bacterium]|nr:CCA tRNA nucleotidyltransferase [Acidobacteriota bacterium]
MKEAALSIVKRLRQEGFSAYFAGGCVRDQVMGNQPKDYDITTNARPGQVMQIFPRTAAVGAQFGVVLVLIENHQVEVATFRSDGSYADGRHPDEVTYTDDARLDVLRRDFTINGLLCDPLTETVLDYVGGRDDIGNGIVRTIGDPGQRFREDKLRMMRAARFSARFGFELESATRDTIHLLADQILQVSKERLRDELIRILTEGHASRGFQLLESLRLLRPMLPEVSDLQGVQQPSEFHPEGDVWVHTLLMLQLMDETRRDLAQGFNPTATDWSGMASLSDSPATGFYPCITLAMGVLLHDAGKPPTFELKDRIRFNNHSEVGARMAYKICDRFRFTHRQTERITQLVRDHLKFKDLPQMRPSTLKRFLRQDGFEEHLELHRLDCLGSHRNLELWRLAKENLAQLKPEEIRPAPLISGDDLIALGYQPGPVFKEILQAVEDAQLDLVINTREDALRWVEGRFERKSTPSQV